ncbi:unnamed protein product, partial [Eruca vesicaria subsp. sativa]|nr:unnamed protein product [Eruca vesicaria subsp. sativa]
MALRRSLRGKAVDDGTAEASLETMAEAALETTAEKISDLLPPRLFATDRFPSGRVNVYSSLDYLLR